MERYVSVEMYISFFICKTNFAFMKIFIYNFLKMEEDKNLSPLVSKYIKTEGEYFSLKKKFSIK